MKQLMIICAAVFFASASTQSAVAQAQSADIPRFETALSQATTAQDIHRLIRAGADVNERFASGDTVLIAAAASCGPETVQALIDHGADVNLAGYNGARTALMEAAAYSGAAMVRVLLDAGADPNLTDMYGRTALMTAAARDDRESMRLLLDAGADINAADGDIGMTPLMYAAWSGAPETIQFLLDRGADAGVITYNRWYAYDYAGFNEKLAGTRVLQTLSEAVPQT